MRRSLPALAVSIVMTGRARAGPYGAAASFSRAHCGASPRALLAISTLRANFSNSSAMCNHSSRLEGWTAFFAISRAWEACRRYSVTDPFMGVNSKAAPRANAEVENGFNAAGKPR